MGEICVLSIKPPIMKRKFAQQWLAVMLLVWFPFYSSNGQKIPANNPETGHNNQELLDMKLELLNSRIELFHSQLDMWESKPYELEQRLLAVDQKISKLNFDPGSLNTRLSSIESEMAELRLSQDKEQRRSIQRFRPDSVVQEPFTSAIALNPVRLMEGIFHLSYEHVLTPKLGLEVAGLATYATEEGISGFYIKNQALAYYNDLLDSSIPYHNKNISGYGVGLKLKNYLLTDLYRKQRAPVGLYAAPGLLFRRLWLTGISEFYLDEDWVTEEVTQLLNIFAMEGTVGWKISFLKVLYVDVYVGGMIRLARYDHEGKFTRYKDLRNIDFSGVLPTAGISLGILK